MYSFICSFCLHNKVSLCLYSRFLCGFVLFGLWCLTPLSTIVQLYRGGQFFWWGNRNTRRKPPTCRKSLTNFITYNVWGSKLTVTTVVVIGNDCTCSCKSNYHTITTTMASVFVWHFLLVLFSITRKINRPTTLSFFLILFFFPYHLLQLK